MRVCVFCMSESNGQVLDLTELKLTIELSLEREKRKERRDFFYLSVCLKDSAWIIELAPGGKEGDFQSDNNSRRR